MANEDSALKPVPVRRRSAARLAAVQVGYQALMSGKSVLSIAPEFLQHYVDDVIKSFRVKDIDHDHFSALTSGMETHAEDLDVVIAECLASGWSLDRLTLIERSLLRAGTMELSHMPHLPARAVVSEYAGLSDACGGDVGFVNAVLDKVAKSTRIVEMNTAR
jgi:transcription antitermination protein NusB